MTRVVCVLKSGGDYGPDDVQRLWNGVRRQAGHDVPFACLSDVPVPCERISLQHSWPGWWSKMELFRPDIEGDLLYLDLDSMVTGPLDDIRAVKKFTLLSDFYHLEIPASGVMLLPQETRAEIWKAWVSNPSAHMARCQDWDRNGVRGDGKFIGDVAGHKAARWQDVLPGQFVSYKCHVRKAERPPREKGNGSVPSGARVVCFHAKPRPLQVNHAWIREASADWAGETVIIVGGGPSAAGFDLTRFLGRGRVIAINDCFLRMPWADAVFSIDSSWVEKRVERLTSFKGCRIFGSSDAWRPPVSIGACEVLFNQTRGAGIPADPMQCCEGGNDLGEGGNSGFACFTMAAARKPKRILLVGFDMTGTAGHWHAGYEWKCRFGAGDHARWVANFEAVAPRVEKLGIEVINLNRQSAIHCFRFAGADEIMGVAA